MKPVFFISLFCMFSASPALAQSSVSEIEEKTRKPAAESKTLKELKTDVMRLSYQKNGRRVFVLRSEDGLDEIVEPSDDLPVTLQGDEADRPARTKRKKKRRKKRRRAIRAFEVSCNPMGEVDGFKVSEPNQTEAEAADTKESLKHRRMRRLAELACLEPEFESE